MATVGAGDQLGPARATVRAAPKPAAPTVEGGGVLLVLFSRSDIAHAQKQIHFKTCWFGISEVFAIRNDSRIQTKGKLTYI